MNVALEAEPDAAAALLKSVKKVVDPDGIMNPGKVLRG